MENYISLQKSQLLDSLENQVRFSQLVAVLVGEKGIGKSYTLEQLQSRLKDEICVAHIDASLDIQEEQLQKVISLQLGLPNESLDEIEGIEKNIRTHLRKKALISIDNAHLLSNESLNSLLRLNQSQINHQESVLFLLLAGDDSLPKNISFTHTFKNHQEMCVVFQLEAIEKSEVASLVAAIRGLTLDEVDDVYGSKQLEYFWQLSKGIPSELEYQVSRWKSEKPEIKNNIEETDIEDISYWRGVVYLMLGIIFVSILFYQDEINQIIMPNSQVEQSSSSGINTTKENKPKTKKTIYKGKIGQEKSKTENLETPQLDNDEIIKKHANNKKIVAEGLTTEKGEIKDVAKLKTSEVKNESVDKAKAVIKTPETSKSLKNESSDMLTSSPKSEATSLSKDELFLLDQLGSHYSLQWIGVSQLENAQSFLSNHPLKSRMYIYRRKQSETRYLYLVVSDVFSQRTEANQAIGNYKSLNYSGSPWVKSLSAIQDEINALQQ